ncbi:MAG: hypothetical protein LWW86_16270 [Micrococcales bacterium]|nr:hypothetical protein [Micrococcales bacterium]
MSARTMRATAVLTLGALALTGCGAQQDAESYFRDEVVGIRPAPAEDASGGSMTEANAAKVAAAVLGAAEKAQGQDGAAGTKARQAALSGSALTVANAHAAITKAKAANTASRKGISAASPRVLSVSRGKAWPRAMFVTTTASDKTQQLHLLRSTSVTDPWRIVATATMQPGTQVAAFDSLAEGTPMSGSAKLAVQPAALLTEYAKGMGFPKADPTPHIETKDPFTTTVRTNAKGLSDGLKDLATYTQAHAVEPKTTEVVPLKGGGAVVVGLLKRTDAITLTGKAQSLTPNKEFAALVDKDKLTKQAEVVTYETVLFTVPATGKATLVGVDEQLVSAKGE